MLFFFYDKFFFFLARSWFAVYCGLFGPITEESLLRENSIRLGIHITNRWERNLRKNITSTNSEHYSIRLCFALIVKDEDHCRKGQFVISSFAIWSSQWSRAIRFIEIKFDHLQYLVQHCRDKKATFPNSLNPSHFKVMEDLKRLKGGKMTNSPNNYDLQLVVFSPSSLIITWILHREFPANYGFPTVPTLNQPLVKGMDISQGEYSLHTKRTMSYCDIFGVPNIDWFCLCNLDCEKWDCFCWSKSMIFNHQWRVSGLCLVLQKLS